MHQFNSRKHLFNQKRTELFFVLFCFVSGIGTDRDILDFCSKVAKRREVGEGRRN